MSTARFAPLAFERLDIATMLAHARSFYAECDSLMPVGYPATDTQVPVLTREPLDEVATSAERRRAPVRRHPLRPVA